MKKILTYKGAVLTNECDSNRHMNVMYYINKFGHAGHGMAHHLRLIDRNQKETVGLVALEQHVKYIAEVFEEDLLYIESTLQSIGNKSFTIFHEMYNVETGKLVSTMKAVLVLFDKVNRKALPFPANRKKALLSED